ncbi:MAG: M28 family peptidase, partial [Zavarzinella sp.]|nr:M28 family peptidase [Zavarzinella sp.]
MPRMRTLAPWLALLVVAPALHADDAQGRLKKDLYFLASDECEGRGLKTEGINRAALYIASQFKAAGLQAPFEGGSYFQPFAIRETYLEAGPNKLTLSGPDGKDVEVAFNKEFAVSGLSGKGTVGGGLVFAGYGITSEKYDDYKGLDVRNKVVIVLRQNPRAHAKSDPLFTEEEARKHSPLTEKIKLAVKNGAAAVVFVNDLDMAGKDDPLMSFDYASDSGQPAEVPVLHAKRAVIDRALGEKSLATLEAEIDKTLKPRSFAVPGWSAKLQTAIGVRELKAKNVVGYVEGHGPLKDETVVIGAHYDHLGRGERGTKELGSTAIHYGADDNASGTAALMELARRYAARKDREGRRIVFIAFSGEEKGLYGSLAYCEKPVFPLGDTVAMLNMDMVGRLRPDEKDKKDRLVVGGLGTAKTFEKLLDDTNGAFDFHLGKDKSGVGPSDHTSFYLAKVPVYFFFTGEHSEYHTPRDRPETINFAGLAKVTDFVDQLATRIAAEKARPEYVAGAGGSMGGRPSGPKLGLMPRYDGGQDGMEISGVMPGGAAEAAGLKKGDKITAITGKAVKNVQD